MADPREPAGAGTPVDPVQLPAPDRRARHRVDRVEPGRRARPGRASTCTSSPSSVARPIAGARVAHDDPRRRRPAHPAPTPGRRRPGIRVARSGRPPVRCSGERSTSCTPGRSRPAARSRPPPRGASPLFREVPNTHTAHAYDVVARGTLAARPRSCRPAHRTRSTPRDFARRSGNGRRRPRCSRRRMPSLERSSIAASTRSDSCRHRYGYRPRPAGRPRTARDSRPFTAVFLGRGEPRKGLHYALGPGSRRPRASTADSWSTDRSCPDTANRSRRCSRIRASRSPASPTTRWARSARPMSSCCRASRRAAPS